MTYPPPARNYLIKALGGMPDVFDHLLSGLGPDDPRWDKSPDPIRFTLREMAAHLADWEPIWAERLCRVRDETRPLLPSIDEGQLAIANDYKHQAPLESLHRFRAGRAKVVGILNDLSSPDWEKVAEREFVGPLTMQMLASFVLSHDGYHLHQVVEWLKA